MHNTFNMWDDKKIIPAIDQVNMLDDVKFRVVKKRTVDVDGYNFAHGAAVIIHKDKMFATWGTNKGAENTIGEEAVFRVSSDCGETWSEVGKIGLYNPKKGRSHGVFLEHKGKLWTLVALFGNEGEGAFKGLVMEAFVFNEKGIWENQGIVADDFWPLREPVKMKNGNWFIPGCDKHWRAAVAISEGDNLLKWNIIKIPTNDKAYTEANAWIDDKKITLVMRNEEPYDCDNICAAVSISEDYGRTWTTAVESNMPLCTSKPYCGYLSTGQRYLIGNSIKGANKSREALTIAISKPNTEKLSKIYLIRNRDLPVELKSVYGVEFSKGFSYPHAIEYNKNLYVIYSAIHSDTKEGRMFWNINDIEMAVIPVSSLVAD